VLGERQRKSGIVHWIRITNLLVTPPNLSPTYGSLVAAVLPGLRVTSTKETRC